MGKKSTWRRSRRSHGPAFKAKVAYIERLRRWLFTSPYGSRVSSSLFGSPPQHDIPYNSL